MIPYYSAEKSDVEEKHCMQDVNRSKKVSRETNQQYIKLDELSKKRNYSQFYQFSLFSMSGEIVPEFNSGSGHNQFAPKYMYAQNGPDNIEIPHEGMQDAGDGWSGIDVGRGVREVMVEMAVVVLVVQEL